jgi:2-dehydropantoate 2-reductase
MRVLVYGAGSVGLGLASCLLKAGIEVCLIARPDTVRALHESGLTRTGIFGRFHAEPNAFAAYESLKKIQNQTCDFILVCTKSFDSPAAARDISKHNQLFGENTKIVLCQNGWGNAETFAEVFDKSRIYNARVITGFTRRKPSEVEITVHADSIHIGSLFGGDVSCVQPLCEAITFGGIPCDTTEAIEKDVWAKMFYNCALNPLGAILDVPYGRLAENPFTKDLMNHITEEVFAVMTAAGYKTHWQSAGDFLKVFYEKLVPDTAKHKSSTLQDIAAGKKTEIDALTGAVIKLAEKLNLQVPYNRGVYDIIKSIESRNL